MNHLKCIDNEATVAFLQLNTDLSVYYRSVGRNLNLRQEDSLGIRNATDYDNYLKRIDELDGFKTIEKLKAHKRLLSFLNHECLPHLEFFLINIQRHPVDIAQS